MNEHNTLIGCESSPPVRRSVELIIPHKSYTSQSADYDVALIKMKRPVDLKSDPVLPVCLPTGDDKLDTYEGLNATVTGWGRTVEGKDVLSAKAFGKLAG